MGPMASTLIRRASKAGMIRIMPQSGFSSVVNSAHFSNHCENQVSHCRSKQASTDLNALAE
jgi:hypothetical protein